MALHGQGRLDEAIAAYRGALALSPSLVVAHNNLGNALAAQGRSDEAAACYARVVALEPRHVETHYNLGMLHQREGRFAEAARAYARVIELRPALAAPYNNLGNCQNALGLADDALASYRAAFDREDTPQVRANLARALRHAKPAPGDAALRALFVRALREAWARPADLAFAALDQVRADPVVAAALAALDAVAPAAVDGTAAAGLDPATSVVDDASLAIAEAMPHLAADELLAAVLDNAPVCDPGLERLLVTMRRAFLRAAAASTESQAWAHAATTGSLHGGDGHTATRADTALAFHAALARQCFLNEYVWPVGAAESAQVNALRDAVARKAEEGQRVEAAALVALAAYAPLGTLPHLDRLAERGWPESVRALVGQQVDEPARERALQATLPTLTPITDATSTQVRAQYEENPYPRWVRLPAPARTSDVAAYLRERFPHAPLPLSFVPRTLLIAGCGTGQEAVDTALQFPGTRILGVDLSRASLGYAARKAGEMGVANLELAQADLLELGAMGRTFDAISSVGVLHHLADPAAGLEVLTRCLRAGGVMRLGFYSEAARRDVVEARAFIAARGYDAGVPGIRQCRQDLMAERARFAPILSRRDFYTTSECRDLLFHVQEHRLTLPQIGTMLQRCGLRLLGFLLEPYVQAAYRARFPADPAAVDLANWSAFEAAHPYTFAGMYRFWVQKAG